VHNTRIERLWYDVTQGFGMKWKNFFFDLEANHGLDPQTPAHIWLLHALFLSAINEDTQDWAQAWNYHTMSIRGEHARSPLDMFMFGMVQEGPRGQASFIQTQPIDEEIHPDDLPAYGVDWDVHEDARLLAHSLENSAGEWDEGNPFMVPSTSTLPAEVVCDAPGCPFNQGQVDLLFLLLGQRVDCASRDMAVRRLVWCEALALCQMLWNGGAV
jgi:hypothetical protein